MENDRTVVVGGDGAEQPSSRSKLSQMAEFAESRQENETEISSEETSWVPSPLWRMGSKCRKEGEQDKYLADLDMEDIPELQLSPPSTLFAQSPSASFSPLNTNTTFIPNISPMLSRPWSQPFFPTSLRDLRRIQSTSSLTTKSPLNFYNTEESTCPTPPPTTFPPSSPVHTFHFNVFSPSSPLPKVKHHRRSKSGTQVPQLMSSDQQHRLFTSLTMGDAGG
jgi:hypothetical protein